MRQLGVGPDGPASSGPVTGPVFGSVRRLGAAGPSILRAAASTWERIRAPSRGSNVACTIAGAAAWRVRIVLCSSGSAVPLRAVVCAARWNWRTQSSPSGRDICAGSLPYSTARRASTAVCAAVAVVTFRFSRTRPERIATTTRSVSSSATSRSNVRGIASYAVSCASVGVHRDRVAPSPRYLVTVPMRDSAPGTARARIWA